MYLLICEYERYIIANEICKAHGTERKALCTLLYNITVQIFVFLAKNLQTQSHQETKKNTKEDHHNYYLTLWDLCSLRVLVLSKLFCSFAAL